MEYEPTAQRPPLLSSYPATTSAILLPNASAEPLFEHPHTSPHAAAAAATATYPKLHFSETASYSPAYNHPAAAPESTPNSRIWHDRAATEPASAANATTTATATANDLIPGPRIWHDGAAAQPASAANTTAAAAPKPAPKSRI